MKHVHTYKLAIDYGAGETNITSGTDYDYINKVYHNQVRYGSNNAIIILYKDRQYVKSSFGKVQS